MALSHSGIKKNAALRAGWSHYKSAEKRIKDYQNETLVQIPSFYFPHSGYTGSLWLELQPRKLNQINTGGRGGTFSTSDEGPLYRFLAPTEGINETHNHDWQVYDSMHAKLLKMFSNLAVGWKKAKQTGTQNWQNITRYIDEGNLPTASRALNDFLGTTAYDKEPRKIDSPLAYENSARRQFIFTFPLLSEGLKTNLVKVVKEIQGFAAPTTNNNSTIEIGWPHVWSIQSEPKGIIDVDLAACTSVQVDWMHPFLGGVPQRCNLTLSFTDISPLFSQTIKYGSLVEVNPQSKTIEEKTWADHLGNKGTLGGEIKDSITKVRETLGGFKTNTPINP